MAEFNPQVQDTGTPNYSQRAPDVGPNKAFEALFSGIGDAIEAGTKTADTYIKNKIEDNARDSFDRINDEFGLSVNTAPEDMLNAKDDLSRLAMARSQGKVNETYYYQRLAMTLKGLRAKYPGYEKEVDDIVQNVTGVRPANAFRDALFSNIQAAEAQNATTQSKFQKFVLENPEVTVTHPDILTNPEKYSDASVQAEVMTGQLQYKGRVEVAKNNKALFEADEAVAGPARSQYINTLGQGYIQGAANELSLGNTNSMLSKALSDNQITPDEKAAITQYILQTKQKFRSDIMLRNGKNEFGTVKTGDLNTYITDAMAPFDEIQKYIESGNLSAAGQAADNLALAKDQAALDMFQQFPELRVAAAVRQFSEPGADQIFADVVEKNGGHLSFANKLINRAVVGATLDGSMAPPETLSAIRALKDRSGSEKEQMIGAWVNSSLEAVQTGKMTPEKTAEFVKNWYTGSNVDELFGILSGATGNGPSQKFRLYTKLFDPKMTEAIVAQGDPKVLAQYADAAMDKAQQIPEFRTAAADLGEGIEWSKYARVQYDPASNKMRVFVNNAAMEKDGLFQRADQRIHAKRLQRFADAYNSVLGVVAPIVEAEGGDELEGIKNFSQSLALNLDGEFKKGILWSINEMLRVQGKPGEAPNPDKTGKFEEVVPEGQTLNNNNDELDWQLPAQVSDAEISKAQATGDYSGVLNLIGRAEGTDKGRGYNETLDYGRWTGGPQDLTKMTINDVLALQGQMLSNPQNRALYGNGKGSSALGRYQIVRKTLRSLVQRLGLSGEELFDEQMQDRLARVLIEGRGKNASSLRNEWEGLRRVPASQIAMAFNEEA